VQSPAPSPLYALGKRTFDLVLALTLLVLLSPLLALVAVAVRVTLGAPVLFAQTRPGRFGAPFRIYKFRTMRAPTPGAAGDPSTDAARLTRLGVLLRKLSLDELPELWNVVRGEMSLVGPRPLLLQYLPLYSVRQSRRHEVRPGITGWAQVNGRNALDWPERLELDVWYVEHAGFLLDLRILLRTAFVVLSRRGISGAGSATMTPFTGTH